MIRLISLFIGGMLLFAPGAYAELSGSALEHAQSAFLFADRNDWNNALLHARASHDGALAKLVTWEYALSTDSNASFEEITQFMHANPDWPEQKRLRIRAEMALRGHTVPDHDIIAWFGKETPITGVGKLALAEALERIGHGSESKVTSLIREAWRGGDFDETEEAHILDAYGKRLRREDDIRRTDRLLWEEKITAATRMLRRLPSAYQKLFKARMSLIADKKLATLMVALVPSSLKDDPGLIYDRMCYRARRGDDRGVREMLLDAPAEVPYPEKWWRQRDVQIREAIAENNYRVARKLLANHGQIDGSEQADALWLEGWLQSEFLNQPNKAYDSFYHMYDDVSYPVSKARAAYWAGRAAEKSGDAKTAANWYDSATAYPTTFYGQLASLKTHASAPLRLPAPPVISKEARHEFDHKELVQAARICIELHQNDLAKKLVGFLVDNAHNDAQSAMAAQLGQALGHASLSVYGAKKAMQQRGLVLTTGYPMPAIPANLAVERPLALAIARQESEFDAQARSPSGAVGLMQMLTATAKEIARKNALPFHKERLTETHYNVTLGSLYLNRLIKSYDGSYIMGIAAYNAGPGNVRRWAQQFGTPGNAIDSAVNWIEKIPFPETRNYVQRVLENIQVYRYLEAGDNAPKLKLGEDLAR